MDSVPDAVFPLPKSGQPSASIASQLYSRAIEQYLDKRKDALVTEPSNAVYAANQGAVDPALPPPSSRYSLMKRGDIWRARLASPIGSGPGHKRPVVVQRNPFNDSRIATVVVAMITSNLALAEAPGNVRIAKSGSGPFTATRRQCLASTLDGSVLVSGVNHSLAPSWTRPPQV